MPNNDKETQHSHLTQTITIKRPGKNKSGSALHGFSHHPSLSERQKIAPTIRKLRSLLDSSEYGAFFQNLYDGVMITDSRGRMVDVNSKACKLCNCSREYLCERYITDVIPGINQEVLDSMITAIRQGRHVLVDTECLKSDGTVFLCEVTMTPFHLSGMEQMCFFVRDITKREDTNRRLLAQEQELDMGEKQLRESLRVLRKREHELSRERDVLQSLMDTIPDRIFFRDEQGRFLRTNFAMTRFLGANNPADIVGKTDFDFYEERQARIFFDDDCRVMREGKPILDKVQQIKQEDGSFLYSAVSKAPMKSQDGKIIGLVGISRDITARVRTEQDLKVAQTQLSRMRRLEATALFAGQIAHDFNNLLMPLLLYPEMIKKHLDPASPAFKDLDIIENTAQQIAELNQDLMALARRGKVHNQIVDVHAVVSDVVDFVRRSVNEKHLDIEWSPAAKLSHTKFDATQLSRVMHNMFQNAIDAVDKQGCLVLSTENVSLAEPFGKYIQISPGEYVKLSIADNGIGIPDEIKDKIFDPFFTTKSSGKKRGGSGLGLSIVYGILSDYDCYLDMESEVGKGTTFFMYFPMCHQEKDANAICRLPVGSETILIVEDEPSLSNSH